MFKYTIDPEANEPVMLLDKAIGIDADTLDGIDGADFQRELLALDNMGKKRIQVWINSPGGYVMDGYNIFNAILKSNTPVDTYNYGIAGSIAGVIFMAGRRRYMADYAQMMVHNPAGSDNATMMQSMKASLVTMLTAKSNLTTDSVAYMMDRTTWMGASECLQHGFATDMENTKASNRKWMGDPTAYWAESNKVINSILSIQKPHTMQKITNKLNLVEGSNEDAILTAINAIENKASEAIAQRDALQTAVTEAATKVTDLQTQLDAANAKITAAEQAAKDATDAANLEKATNMVKEQAAAGRIKNDEAVIAKWTNLAVTDFDGTKAMIEDLPVNKTAPQNVVNIDPSKDKRKSSDPMQLLAEIKNKLQTQN